MSTHPRAAAGAPDYAGEVLRVCRDLLALGIYPGQRKVHRFLPEFQCRTIARHRARLVAAGLLELPPTPNRPKGPPKPPRPSRGPASPPGLAGRTPEERDEIRRRYLEVRAEKIARGEGPAARPWTVPVGRDRPDYHHHDPREGA